jgi:hypothetical protein
MDYSYGKPTGGNGVPQFDAPPAVVALSQKGTTNAALSSVLTLTENTTQIEVAVRGSGAAIIKWIATSDTVGSVYGVTSVGATNAANFDHAISADTVRHFVIPIEAQTSQGYGSIQGANRENGLYRRVAYVAQGGISSVLVTEYR